MNEDALESLRVESKSHMVTGILLLEQGRFSEALPHFDNAVTLRRQFPWREDGLSAWLLAAALLNRSDALRGLGEANVLPEAVQLLDETLEAMRHVPLAENPLYVERVVLAWINRGTACGEMGHAEDSLAGFSEAENVLTEWNPEATPRRIFLSVMLRVNRARVLLALGRAEDGWRDAREAVRILRMLDTTAEVAMAGIKARSIQCRALAMLLDEPGGVEKVGDWIAEATDSAEEALAWVRASGYRDVWIADLVRYGAKIYRACQPQFLAEFLDEWLTGDGPLAEDELLKNEMRNELLLAMSEVERRVLLLPQDTEFVERQLRILAALQASGLGVRLSVRK